MAVRVRVIMKVKTRMKLRMRILCFRNFAFSKFHLSTFCFRDFSLRKMFFRDFDSNSRLHYYDICTQMTIIIYPGRRAEIQYEKWRKYTTECHVTVLYYSRNFDIFHSSSWLSTFLFVDICICRHLFCRHFTFDILIVDIFFVDIFICRHLSCRRFAFDILHSTFSLSTFSLSTFSLSTFWHLILDFEILIMDCICSLI
jgi:hypothetical protein